MVVLYRSTALESSMGKASASNGRGHLIRDKVILKALKMVVEYYENRTRGSVYWLHTKRNKELDGSVGKE